MDEEQHPAVSQVFSNPMLREIIARNVLFEPSPVSNEIGSKVSWNARVLRSINSNWHETIIGIMNSENLPLLTLRLCGSDNTCVIEFLEFFESHPNNTIPSFRLIIDPGYFRLENHSLLRRILTSRVAANLLDLRITIRHGPRQAPNLVFPPTLQDGTPTLGRLHTFSFRIDAGEAFTQRFQERNESVRTAFFVSSILAAAPNSIKTLELSASEGQLPDALATLPLSTPSCVSKLKIDFQFGSSSELEQLLVSLASKLIGWTHLYIQKQSNVVSSSFSRAIQNLPESIKELIIAEQGGSQVQEAELCSLPSIRALNCLAIQTSGLRPSHPLQDCFPFLYELRLENQTPSSITGWTNQCVLPTVRKLALNLKDDIVPRREIVAALHKMLPFLHLLEMDTCGEDVQGIKYVLSNMCTLKTLNVRILGDNWFGVSEYWDSVLLDTNFMQWRFRRGILSLRESPSKNSIVNLRELETLVLRCDEPPNLSHHSIVSAVTFDYGFLKMEKLRTLVFIGEAFKVEEESALEWARLGKQLILQS